MPPTRSSAALLLLALAGAATGCAETDARECRRSEPCGVLRDDELTGEKYECLMTALRDGGPGKVSIHDSAVADSSSNITVVFGDGAAILQTWGYSNGSGDFIRDAEECTLKPPSFFEACLASPSLTCAQPSSWVDACVEAPEFSCP